MSRWWDINICDDCYMLLLRDTGEKGGICDLRYPGVYSLSMSARCCPMCFSSCCLSISDVFLDIVVLLTDTYTYCLYTHNGDGSF